MILVTGGAGFIGSAFVLEWIHQNKSPVVTLDSLTYAGNLYNLRSIQNNPLHTFIQGDIANRTLLRKLFTEFKPRFIVHCAAETHVDRSIAGPESFIKTNIEGTFALLEESLDYWKLLPDAERQRFRFLNLSTDEVYGSLSPSAPPSCEGSPYAPNSPYAASKAAADHLVRAYHQTYALPTLTTHSSNNFGPRQHLEKLIPLVLFNALNEKAIPLYGDGLNSRDWIYVDDHCEALRLVLENGTPGEHYNISSGQTLTNLELVKTICALLDGLKPRSSKTPYSELICFVKDRPGHDRRYAINSSKIQKELGWQPKGRFEERLKETILWYLENPEWVKQTASESYRRWTESQYPSEEPC